MLNNYSSMSAFGMGNSSALSMGTPVGVGLATPDVPKISFSGQNSTLPSTSGTSGITASVDQPMTPDVTGNQGGFFKNSNGQWNTDNIQMLAGGLETLGKLYMAFQQAKIARETLGLQKEMFQENLRNQRMSYNNALEDRIKSRHAFDRTAPDKTQDEIARKSL